MVRGEFELLTCRYCYHINELSTYEVELYRSFFEKDVPREVLLPQFGDPYHPLNSVLGSSYLFIIHWVYIINENVHDLVDITNSKNQGIISIDNNILCQHIHGILGPVLDTRIDSAYFEKLRILSSDLDNLWLTIKGRQIFQLITEARANHDKKLDKLLHWYPKYRHEFLTSAVNHPYHHRLRLQFSLTNKDDYRMLIWHYQGALYILYYIKKDQHKYIYLEELNAYIELFHDFYTKTQHPITNELKKRIGTLQFLCA